MISPGELAKGMLVTVHHWAPVLHAGAFGSYETADRSWCGSMLRVTAVCLPYVRVQVLGAGQYCATIDTRQCVLMDLPEDFAEAKEGDSV